MRPYCPGCLDVWCIEEAKFRHGDFLNIQPGIGLHVGCGRALEALRTVPPVTEQEWAA